MGRRSRKRAAGGGESATRPAATRAERDAARRERSTRAGRTGAPERRRSLRPSADDRPPAPWGSFPLSELVVLLGLVLIGWGVVSGGHNGNLRIVAGLAVASLAGLELAIREHWAGFRSHTTLLAGVCAFAAVTVLALGPGPHVLGPLLGVGAAVFAVAFYGLRHLFKRRSGGLSYR